MLWMKQTLQDYKQEIDSILIYCDNTSIINLSVNHVHHSRTKHIKIRYHFLRDYVQKYLIQLHFVPTSEQIADILTKPLGTENFIKIRIKIGLMGLLFCNFYECITSLICAGYVMPLLFPCISICSNLLYI